MATANPYGAAMDPYAGDPTAAIRARVMAQLGGGSGEPSVPAGTGASTTATAPVQSANFFAAPPAAAQAPPTTPAPATTPAPTTAPPAATGAIPNPYDTANPANQGSGGTYNQPAVGNDANQIYGWYSNYLGRSANASEVTQWLNSGLSLTDIQNRIANSPEAQAWGQRPGGSLNPTPPPPPAAAAPPPGTAAVTAPPTSGFTDALRQVLMQRLQSASAPVDENSPQIQASIQAARDEGSRSADAERTALAERLYAQGGLNTNALTQQIQQSSEKNAANVGTLRATLLMNAYTQKQQELENDLQLAFASGDAESARAIQIQMANLQATVQREGIGANLAINGAAQNAATVTAAGR